MLNIRSVLNYILNDLSTDSDRFTIIDWQHVLDNKTGIKLHMYDDSFHITRDGEEIIRSNAFTEEEKKVVWDIKALVAGPEKMKSRMEEYPKIIIAQRRALSEYFENPEPIESKQPVAEPDTEEYNG